MKTHYKSQYKKAEVLYEQSYYEEALSVFKKIVDYEEDGNVSNYIGCCYLNTNRLIEAEKCFVNLHKRFPKWETPLYNLGRLYIKLKEFDKAEHYIKLSLKINPNSADANFYMGLYFEKSDKLEKAIEFYNISVEIEDSIEGYLNLSICYNKLGDSEQALVEARKAYRQDPFDNDAIYNLTYILIKKKHYNEVYNLLNDDYWMNSNDVGILKNFLFSSIKTSNFITAKIVAKKIVDLDNKNRLANDFLRSYNANLKNIGDNSVC